MIILTDMYILHRWKEGKLHQHPLGKELGELVGFNVPINTSQVISETSLSSQSLALVLTT